MRNSERGINMGHLLERAFYPSFRALGHWLDTVNLRSCERSTAFWSFRYASSCPTLRAMHARAQERVQAFADATTDKQHLSADDVERFCTLSIELYRARLGVTGEDVRHELERCGFDSSTALRLRLQFARYVHLLEQADSGQSSSP